LIDHSQRETADTQSTKREAIITQEHSSVQRKARKDYIPAFLDAMKANRTEKIELSENDAAY
jgi:hypothetical protein